MQRQYEIHFIQFGRKHVLRVSRDSMSEVHSWKLVTIEAGACVGEIHNISSRKKIIEVAKRLHIQEVRWNRASHTMAFVERARLLDQTIKLIDITSA